MKIRDGHVSNSSSSTFILITTKENYEACLKKADPLAKEVAKKKLSREKIRLLGRDMVKFVIYYSDEPAFMGWSEDLPKKFFKDVPRKLEEDSDDYSYYDDDNYERRCDEKVEEAWDAFCALLGKNADETFSARE